ncbi:MAG: alginate lyase family protein, partial [Clostridia bacterium]|nr:alginate lyase family protein [Clostridia bacterium]
MVEVTERYVTNETAHDAEPYILGCDNSAVKLQYGKSYVSAKVRENIKVNNTEYVLISDIREKRVNTQSGEENGSIVFDYRYVKKDDLFIHPGALNTQADLERIREAVKSGKEPYSSGYNALTANSYAQLGAPRAVGTIIRGGTGDNCALLYRDAHRAYLCAIRWKISGDEAYADCARDILNAWSGTLKLVSGNADRYLAAGLYGYELACAAELIRDYEGFELERMQDMLLDVFYPMNERFLYSSGLGDDHNGAHVMNYWANWDLCNMASSVAIGVFCDRRDIYERALEYYKYGAGNGSVFNAVPKVYEASGTTLGVPVGQWQEAGRDMEHTMMGVGLMATVCEIAWNQGDDLYSWANNR